MKDQIKNKLFNEMLQAVIAYKESNGGIHTENSEYFKAQKAAKAFAEYAGITYKQACSLAVETL